MDKAVNCGVMRPGFKSRWGREEFRIVRSVSVCEKCFGVVRIGGLNDWAVRVSVLL